MSASKIKSPSKSNNSIDDLSKSPNNRLQTSLNSQQQNISNTDAVGKFISAKTINQEKDKEIEKVIDYGPEEQVEYKDVVADDNDNGNDSDSDNHTENKDHINNDQHSLTTLSAKNNKKRRKVGAACVFCRRSHMNCDNSRPCKRCIKRNIGHLCHDNNVKDSKSIIIPNPNTVITESSLNPTNSNTSNQIIDSSKSNQQIYSLPSTSNFLPSSSTALNQQPFFYSEHAGSEFNSLTEFLSMIDDNDMMDSINLTNDPMLQKLEATNYINGFSTSSANLQNMLNTKSSNDLSNIQNTINSTNLQLSNPSNTNISKMDQNQINYIQQQLNVQQQKILQQNQFLQQKQND
ncbi:hypothetical protein C6P40_002954, partial [Pichia californica]